MGFLEIRNQQWEALIKLCKNCRSAMQGFCLSRPILICSNKFGCEGKLYVVEPKSSCRNFQPERIFSCRQGITLRYFEDVRYIPLTQGKFAIVDAEDYDWLSQYKWYASKQGTSFYACRVKGSTTVSMHREIMKAPKGLMCDHKNHNSLDNRKSNLRLCTRAQNQYNKCAKKNCLSRYKGVILRRDCRKWSARIGFNYKRIHLGHFFDEIKAALAYDNKAIELFGEFAYLNFPERIELRNCLRKIVLFA